MNAFSNLMAPIKLGNTVVKSRMMFPNALPHFQQGPENYPADPLVTFYSDIAKNGAGIVPVHWQDKVEEVVTSHENVTAIRCAKTTKIEKDAVTYVDKDGAEHVIKCDDIVAAGGMKPLQEEAMAFYGSAPEFYMIGDGKKVGYVRICLREAFAAASQV